MEKSKRNFIRQICIIVCGIAVLASAVIFDMKFQKASAEFNAPDDTSADTTACEPVTTSPVQPEKENEKVPEKPNIPDTSAAETTACEPDTSAVETTACEPVTTEPVQTEKADNGSKTGHTGKICDIPTVYSREYYDEVVAREGIAPDGYIDGFAFLGDSTTYGMGVYKVLDWSQVWVPSNGTLTLSSVAAETPLYDAVTNSERTLADMCISNKPKYLVITLGANGMVYLSDDMFKSYYCNVIDTIQKANPDITVVLQSIYPVCASCSLGKNFNNSTISHANELIVEIAYAYGLSYLDTYSALIDGNGYRPEGYTNGDGLHFSRAGFDVILGYIKSHPVR